MKHIKRFIKWRLIEGIESEPYMRDAVEWLYNMLVSSLLSMHEDELSDGTVEELVEEFGINIINRGDRVILECRETEYIGYYSGNNTTTDLDWMPGASFYMELLPILSEWNPELEFLYTIGTVDFGDHVKGIMARVEYQLSDLKRGGWQLETNKEVRLMFNSGIELEEDEFASFIVEKLLNYAQWFNEEEILAAIKGARKKNRY